MIAPLLYADDLGSADPISHPILGQISVDWILSTLAGHDLHHLAHLEIIGKA